jgi:hypothetical protein
LSFRTCLGRVRNLQFATSTLNLVAPALAGTIVQSRPETLPCPALSSRPPSLLTTSHFRILRGCRSALPGAARVPLQDTSCTFSLMRISNPAISDTRSPAHVCRKPATAIRSVLLSADTHNRQSPCSSCLKPNICRSTAASWNTTASQPGGCRCIPSSEFRNSPTAFCSHTSAASSDSSSSC